MSIQKSHKGRSNKIKSKGPLTYSHSFFYYVKIQDDQKDSVHLTITVQKARKIQYFKQFQSPTMIT